MLFKNRKIAKHIVAAMRKVYNRKLTTSLGGNISVLYGDKIFITPSQIDKENIKAKQILIFGRNGEVLKGKNLRPSMETQMHIAIYNVNPNARAIVHCHPLWASLLCFSDLKFFSDFTDEGYYFLRNIAFAQYATMGTQQLADNVAAVAYYANIVVLKNHGIVSIADNLLTAIEQLEVLENACLYSFLKQNTVMTFDHLSLDACRAIDERFGLI